MGYGRNTYRRGSQRTYRVTTGRIGRVNTRPGPCKHCGEDIPAGAGQLWREQDGTWKVVHTVAEWHGSPVSGLYVGGCPGETDRMNESGGFTRGVLSERDRIEAIAATYAAGHAVSESPRRSYGRSAYGRCTHEDYPCCGCGD